MYISKYGLMIATLLLTLSINPVIAMDSAFIAGKDYEITTANVESEPLVEEFFNYACPHCFNLKNFVDEFKENNPYIKVKFVPVELKPSWRIYVKAYFIGEKLGVLDKSHSQIFHRVNVEKKFFNDEQDMKNFFLSIGVDEKAYDEVATSYWLDINIRLSKQYAMKNKVSSTPAFLVNKRYKLNNAVIGSYEKLTQAMVELSNSKK